MTRCDWIVCETTSRWTAALRVAMARSSSNLAPPARVHQVQSLIELTRRLDEQPCAIALTEVRLENLANVLEWLATEAPVRSHARFIALVDAAEPGWQQRRIIADAALAAGAVDIAFSPRHLQHILSLGRRHAEIQATAPAEPQPCAEWAWSLLPWQGS